MSNTKVSKRRRTGSFQAEVRTILTALGEDPERPGLLKTPVIYDGRNIYEPSRMKEMGFTYRAVGRA